MTHFFRTALLLLAMAMAALPGATAWADTWRGTAPICRGKCLPGEAQLRISDDGDGGHCFSGHKVLCANREQTCKTNITKSSCVGVVMICQNGNQDSLSGVFNTCTTFACGACLFGGSGEVVHTSSFSGQSGLQGGQPAPVRIVNDTCKTGFVWREGVKDDHVCVTPQVRDQAARDNAAAAGRTVPGSSNCKQGFVWRVIVPSDLVCVTEDTRSAAAGDTAQALSRIVGR